MTILTYNSGQEVIGDQWIKLHRNENLFIDRKWLTEIGKNALSSINLSQYPDPYCTHLRKRLGQLYNIDFDHIFIANGSDEILAILLQYLRSLFSAAATPIITYRIYPFLLQRYNYQHLILDNTSQDHLCIIDSPNSLTGEISEVLETPSAFLIWDNVYGEFANNQLNLSKMNSSTVIVRSFSKFFGLANLRIGYCFANPNLVKELMKRKDIYNVNGFAQEMALQVLNEKQYFDSLTPKINKARKMLEEGLRSLGFILSNSQTNCVWITHPFVPAEVLQLHLEQEYIAVRRFLEPNLCNHLRIAVPPLEIVNRLLEIIKKCVLRVS